MCLAFRSRNAGRSSLCQTLILQDIQWVNLATKAAEIMSYVCLVCVGVGKKEEVDITDQVCKL